MQYKLKVLFYLTTLVGFVAWWFPRNSVRIIEGTTALYVESILPIESVSEPAFFLSRYEAAVYGKPKTLYVETATGKVHFRRDTPFGPYRAIGHY